MFCNNMASTANKHDIVGIPGILDVHRKEFEKKKLGLRIDNECYLREHPELSAMLKMFMQDVLNDYPENILEYAGEYFDDESMQAKVDEFIRIENDSN